MPRGRPRERPIAVVWDGQHFIPLPRFQRFCDQQFEVNEEIALIRSEERNMTRHRGYFALIREAWKNLAEEYDGRFPSPEALRAHALVESGYCTETDHLAESPAEARKMAATIRRYSPYTIMKIRGNTLKVFEPESQAQANMGKERFEARCTAVLEIVASMSRSTPAQLHKNADRSA